MFRADGPPLRPDAQRAHRLLSHELAKPAYADHEPVLTRWYDWVHDHLAALLAHSAGRLPPVLLVVIVLAIVAIVAVVVPRLRRHTQRTGAAGSAAVLSGRSQSAEEHRARARQAAGRGEFAEAVVESFRAIARTSEERALLPPAPGRTAQEIARRLHPFFPAEAADLGSAATLFDRVRYKDAAASDGEASGVRALDDRLLHTRPVHPGAAPQESASR